VRSGAATIDAAPDAVTPSRGPGAFESPLGQKVCPPADGHEPDCPAYPRSGVRSRQRRSVVSGSPAVAALAASSYAPESRSAHIASRTDWGRSQLTGPALGANSPSASACARALAAIARRSSVEMAIAASVPSAGDSAPYLRLDWSSTRPISCWSTRSTVHPHGISCV